jgi:hypothetical protein
MLVREWLKVAIEREAVFRDAETVAKITILFRIVRLD